MSTQETKLREIADAIREKEGSTAPIPANDFPARIRAISTAPEGLYTITVEPDNEASGNVSGGGAASEGMVVTVWADAAEDYTFTGWQENGQTVSADAEHTFTVDRNRTLTAIFQAEKVSRLPSGYTEVEYIQSTDGVGQYIATGVTVTNTLYAVIDFEPLAATDGRYIIGGQTRSGSYDYYWNAAWGSKGITAVMGSMPTTGSYKNYTISSNTSPRRILLEMFKNGTASVDGGEPVTCKISSSLTYSSVAVTLLGLSSSAVLTSYLPAKVYSCKLEQYGSLVRDFVPCVNPDGIAGLLDLVNSKFYKSGRGTFTAGPAV